MPCNLPSSSPICRHFQLDPLIPPLYPSGPRYLPWSRSLVRSASALRQSFRWFAGNMFCFFDKRFRIYSSLKNLSFFGVFLHFLGGEDFFPTSYAFHQFAKKKNAELKHLRWVRLIISFSKFRSYGPTWHPDSSLTFFGWERMNGYINAKLPENCEWRKKRNVKQKRETSILMKIAITRAFPLKQVVERLHFPCDVMHQSVKDNIAYRQGGWKKISCKNLLPSYVPAHPQKKKGLVPSPSSCTCSLAPPGQPAKQLAAAKTSRK